MVSSGLLDSTGKMVVLVGYPLHAGGDARFSVAVLSCWWYAVHEYC